MHKKGWMHRDLKPGNLMINKSIGESVFSHNMKKCNKNATKASVQAYNQALSEIQLRIGDFGLSKTQEYPRIPMTKEIMTLWYRAPEVILNNLCYSPAIDLWSAGTIIFEMLTGEHMFRGNSEIDMIYRIFNLKGTPITNEERATSQTVGKIKRIKYTGDKENVPSISSCDHGYQPVISNFNHYPHLT